ncbi:MAG: hypothetical protein KY444_04330 [Gemmatimonadetes bacterium]|nr:hypothetical protein [Gemmatimonadota bacterium]
MMIRTLIAALPLVLVLSACGGSVTAPQHAEPTTAASYSSSQTVVTDTAQSDTTSVTGGPMGSGS